MWTLLVVILPTIFDLSPCIAQAREPVGVQALIPAEHQPRTYTEIGTANGGTPSHAISPRIEPMSVITMYDNPVLGVTICRRLALNRACRCSHDLLIYRQRHRGGVAQVS